MNRRMSTVLFTAAGLLLAAVASAQQVLELRPNLVALPAWDISVQADLIGRPEVRFAVTTANLGDGPLELRGGETGSGKQNVYQRVYLEDGSYYDHLAGSFIYHPEHHHIHVEDYAEYRLQRVGAPGSSSRTSAKTSFCVEDTDRINQKLPGAPKKPVYDTCENVIQGLSVGWGDTYGAYLPGQSIDLTDLPDADYELTIIADPKGHFIETTTDDNTSCVLLRIGVSDLSLAVLNPSGCDYPQNPPSGGVTVQSIFPNSGSIGSLVPVTITGTGFADGMSVTFENGSGARLTASDVAVVNESTITAVVTIRKRGQGTDNVWDVRVGSAVLVDGFMVTP
jgi:Lysyl oxidase/IPT/TIG domain